MRIGAHETILIEMGHRIREARHLRGLTQERVAELSDFGKARISRLEAGFINPTMSTLKRIADVLDISVSELLKKP